MGSVAKWRFPVPGDGVTYQNDWGFPRSHGRTHKGTDIFAPRGTPVVAAVGGKVTAAGDDGGAGGLRVWISGSWYYAHLNGLAKGLSVGDTVKAGQIIGYVGDSGNAKGGSTHLHFGYDPKGGQSAGGSWENPYNHLRSAQNLAPEIPAQTAETPSATTPDSTGVVPTTDMELQRKYDVQESIQTMQPTPGFGSLAPGPSEVIPTAFDSIVTAPELPPTLQMWQTLASMENSSQETRDYLQMAQLGYGDNAAP